MKIKLTFIILIMILITLFLIVLFFINRLLQRKLKDASKKLKEETNKLQELEAALQKTEEITIQNNRYHLSVMHDMKNLMLPLVAYSEFLAMENISYEKMKTIAQKMNQNASGLIDRFTNMLEISNEKSKLLISSPVSWNLYDTVKEIHTLLLSSLEKKSISFENQIDPKQMVYADYEMIRSVLLNLLTNAIKFTYNGGKIVVYGEKIEKNLYQVNVKDSGTGIDEKKREELFSSKHYISTTGTAGELGTGFGLALCKDFVNRNGGTIDAENNQNEAGATFRFTVLRLHV